MFRRVVLVLALATLMVMLMVGTVAPALAQTFHPSTPGGPSVTPPPRIATPGQEGSATPNTQQTCANLHRALGDDLDDRDPIDTGLSPVSGYHCTIDVPAA
jgi:hypothetical protein